MGLPVRLLFLTASARPAFFGCLSAGADRPLPGTITVRGRSGSFPTISLSLFRSPPVRILFLTASGQARFLPSLRRGGFSLLYIGRAKYVEPSSFSHDVDSQNLRLSTTRGGRF